MLRPLHLVPKLLHSQSQMRTCRVAVVLDAVVYKVKLFCLFANLFIDLGQRPIAVLRCCYFPEPRLDFASTTRSRVCWTITDAGSWWQDEEFIRCTSHIYARSCLLDELRPTRYHRQLDSFVALMSEVIAGFLCLINLTCYLAHANTKQRAVDSPGRGD